MMRAFAIVALLAGALLAGCNSPNADPASDSGPTFDDLGLQATSSTGVIRGVVVDDAIRPVPGARVTLKGDAPREAMTTDLGTFGFDELAPGTYFLSVSKPGYFDAQQSTEVVAGVSEPPIMKVQLAVDAANMPYFEAYVFSGFIECSTPVFAACGFATDVGQIATGSNVTKDNSQVRYPLSKVPSWVQTEMVWSSTQALGGAMTVMYSYGDCGGGFYCDHAATGASPLLLTAGPEDIAEIGLGDSEPELYIRTFTAPAAEDPVGVVGLTAEQGFEYYTHIFYGYQPTEGWLFSSGEPVPQPGA
jgi:hypothetical protein